MGVATSHPGVMGEVTSHPGIIIEATSHPGVMGEVLLPGEHPWVRFFPPRNNG